MVKRGLKILTIVLLAFAATVYCDAQTPALYNVTRMPFNTSSFNDISPVIGKNGDIMFSSDRRLNALIDKVSFDGRRLFNIFQVKESFLIYDDKFVFYNDGVGFLRDDNDFVIELQSERKMKFNNGPFCICPEGRYIYFTSEVETGKRSQDRNFVNRNGIFIAELSGNQMLNVQPFCYNSLEYDVGQPSLSADGKTLYFASNKPGGYGGSDIYYCELVNGEWTEPVNLGPEVNSSASENYPYIHSFDRLYFSSDREGGFGKLDIYSTNKINGKWRKAILMPEPINSAADDFAFVIDHDMQKGYFTSNRISSDDIYGFTSYIRRMDICDTLQENSYCYRFIEENAIKEADTTPFRYIWKFGDGNTAIGAVVDHCYEKPGSYLVQLDVENINTNEILSNVKSDLLFIEDIVQPYITSPDFAVAGATIKLDADKTYLPGWNIDEYYWNFGDDTIQIGKEVDKTYIYPGTYNIQLIVSEKALSDGVILERCVCKNITISADQ